MEAQLKTRSLATQNTVARPSGAPQKASSVQAPPSGKIGPQGGKIGPNAILQVFASLERMPDPGSPDLGPDKALKQAKIFGKSEAARIAVLAGLGHHFSSPPTAMVDEHDVVALHQAVRYALPDDVAMQILWDAGEQTARYILAHRIPKPAQWLLRAMPTAPSCMLLLKAIAKHAWTFAGSGTYTYQLGHPARITLTNCPACDQVYGRDEPCTYYIATIQNLFQALVHRRATLIQETSEKKDGKTDVRARNFVLTWR